MIASLEQADAVEDVSQGAFVAFGVHVVLAVTRAHLEVCVITTLLCSLGHVVLKSTAATEARHIGF